MPTCTLFWILANINHAAGEMPRPNTDEEGYDQSADTGIYLLVIHVPKQQRERSGSVVECLTRYREAAGSSLTDVTALCP